MSRPQKARHRRDVEADFICTHCGVSVTATAMGTGHRNHCPRCLWSCHVDVLPGDRRCPCRAPMEPISVWVRDGGEWAVIHRCVRCTTLRSTRIAGDDRADVLVRLAERPLGCPAFPSDPIHPRRSL